MLYAEAKRLRARIEARVADASAALSGFPKLANGLTPDEVKFGFDYRVAKIAYDSASAELRQFNTHFLKAFEKQIRFERRQRRTHVGSQ